MLTAVRSASKWYTSLEQPHDEIHLAIGGQDHRPIKSKATKMYDKIGDLVEATNGASEQARLE